MIQIIDNFLDADDLKMIQTFSLEQAHYVPAFFEDTTEKTKENFYGNRFYLKSHPKIFNKLIGVSQKKFKIKIHKVCEGSGIDQRNLDHFKPHRDNAKINILIMIHGPTAITNGTVFYTDNDLDIHVGFRENRAVMFPSNYMHSQHAM